MTITTKHVSNAAGRPQVLAKGGDKQRTVSWDLSKSADWNHGNAAGTLSLVLWQGKRARQIAADVAVHVHLNDGRHQFRFPL